MVVDFGLIKGGRIGEFIDSFDHAWTVWEKEYDSFKHAVTHMSDRYVQMPVSPSAENYALMFAGAIQWIIERTQFGNDEGYVELHSVRVHETETGWAEADLKDVVCMYPYTPMHLVFSEAIRAEWTDPEMFSTSKQTFIHPTPEKQI
jgi:6-pyruvoyltetrahydropterin/6-carboxytetrahydropterin synthase